jgi:hypothetical protein
VSESGEFDTLPARLGKSCMIAARIIQRLNSDTIKIPDAERFIGKDVEVIVLVDSPEAPSESNVRKLILGSAKNKVWISPDFDAPLPDHVLKEFYK